MTEPPADSEAMSTSRESTPTARESAPTDPEATPADRPAASVDPAVAPAGAPLLRVVQGDPTPEELAALVAVLTARAAAPAPAPDTARASDWATYWRHTQRPLHPGPGRWRASAHP